MARARIVLFLSLLMLLATAAPATAAAPTSVDVSYHWVGVGVTIRGWVSPYDRPFVSGTPTPTVELQRSSNGADWTKVATAPLDEQSGYSFSQPGATVGKYYRVHFRGTDADAPAYSRATRIGFDYPLIQSTAFPPVAPPMVPRMIDCSPNFIRPIAYDIKSLQTTAFRFASGERGTRARLVVRGARSDGGDLVLLDKVVDATVDSGWDVGPGPYYVTWNGRDEKGGRLRYSAGYTWTLSVSLPGRAPESASGTVIVSRILFVRSGASFGLPSIQTGYLRPGAVNVYLTTGTQVATGDTLSLKLSGPGGLSTRTRSFAVGRGTTCSARFAGSDAPRRSGIHSFTFTARRSSDYRMTVIQ